MKKIIAFILVLPLALSLCACSRASQIHTLNLRIFVVIHIYQGGIIHLPEVGVLSRQFAVSLAPRFFQVCQRTALHLLDLLTAPLRTVLCNLCERWYLSVSLSEICKMETVQMEPGQLSLNSQTLTSNLSKSEIVALPAFRAITTSS